MEIEIRKRKLAPGPIQNIVSLVVRAKFSGWLEFLELVCDVIGRDNVKEKINQIREEIANLDRDGSILIKHGNIKIGLYNVNHLQEGNWYLTIFQVTEEINGIDFAQKFITKLYEEGNVQTCFGALRREHDSGYYFREFIVFDLTSMNKHYFPSGMGHSVVSNFEKIKCIHKEKNQSNVFLVFEHKYLSPKKMADKGWAADSLDFGSVQVGQEHCSTNKEFVFVMKQFEKGEEQRTSLLLGKSLYSKHLLFHYFPTLYLIEDEPPLKAFDYFLEFINNFGLSFVNEMEVKEKIQEQVDYAEKQKKEELFQNETKKNET